MQFEELRARLTELPHRLPPAPRALMPVLVPTPDGGRPVVPRFPAGTPRNAAVLVLFHAGPDGEARVVLTERSAGGHRHAGQVSLPGGAIDEAESIVAAALREAREEVGLEPEQAGVVVVGSLAPVDVRVSGFRVYPVIATAAREPVLTADEREVAAIISAEVAAFLPGAPIGIETAERDGMRLRYGAYPIGAYRVWGATARIMGGLGAWLARAG
ncbi:MAG TPA: CoA pyrophosphatase [Candidatus Caenarcaniphilales bacterium]|nr:CoA pyrophosphatase [Candidatus Caenarcaniphilales bacterium]